ncbi:MAG: phosphotransferase [Acidimicrobiales bacterium]|nr:phosphotransferase [Acidimicrobiales bacterium]
MDSSDLLFIKELIGSNATSEKGLISLPSGEYVFIKSAKSAPSDFYQVEERGISYLAETNTVLVPKVFYVSSRGIALEYIEPKSPTRLAAENFGIELANLHRHNEEIFGGQEDGYIGSLPMKNTQTKVFADFYRECRLMPFLKMAKDKDSIRASDISSIEELCNIMEDIVDKNTVPSRIHGDLWSGNVIWRESQVVLIDPSAHNGHREADIAMLHLFGAPFLDVIVASYNSVYPLESSWKQRLSLHQIYYLLVHAVLFGGSYGHDAGSAGRNALSQI